MHQLGPLRAAGPAGMAVVTPALPVDAPAPSRGILRWVGLAVSLLIVAAAVNHFRGEDWDRIVALIPASPLFWGVFVLAYFAQPIMDFVIFRRLWKIPAAGFPALVRKFISNEVLLGYTGELYFYTWARRRATKDGVPGAIRTGAPFGAIKDVAILSALIGNVVTLAAFLVAWPMLGQMGIDLPHEVPYAIAVLLASSLVVMLLRGRVFSLSKAELGFVAGMQLVRVLVSAGLLAVMWSLVLPAVPFVYWLMLTSLRLLISRLPLIPNKDVVFAGVAVLIVGHGSDIQHLMALMAGLLIAVHVVVGGALVVSDLSGLEGEA